jgi:hypothetical protein
MEVLTILSATLLVVMMAALHSAASPEHKPLGAVALAFATLVAGLTGAVHFVDLTALRQLGTSGIQWPSVLYAVELLAWDVFLGLSLIFAAPTVQGKGLRGFLRGTLFLAGGLSLLGTIGPVMGDMRLQRVGVFGYGVVFPVACLLLFVVFRQSSKGVA